MTKKTLFAKARVYRGARWYIDISVVSTASGAVSRHRKDFDLNEISDVALRGAVADRLALAIEMAVEWAAGIDGVGEAVTTHVVDNIASVATLSTAAQKGLAIKIDKTVDTGHKGYKRCISLLLQWAKKGNVHDLPIEAFKADNVRDFLKWLQKRRAYKGQTLVNYVIHLHSIWTEIFKEYGLKIDNPWRGQKNFATSPKVRRPFSDEEKVIVSAYFRENDYWLFRAVLLIYYCYMRPVELRRLRFRDIDPVKGLVNVHVMKGKKRYDPRTIPSAILHFFREERVTKCVASWYVFGKDAQPNADAATDGKLYKRHQRHLRHLADAGHIKMAGLSLYSWKDTGISTHIAIAAPVATRDQAGHQKLETTMVYYQKPKINEQYRDLPYDLG